MRKPSSERLSNLPKDTQRAGDSMRTRAQIYNTMLNHFRMASELLLLRDMDLNMEGNEIFKMHRKKIPRSPREKFG